MKKAQDYNQANRERYLDELFEILRIPSISAQSEHRGDMERCAEAIKTALLRAGADRAEVMPTTANPVVYGEKIVDPAARTVLVYGHYDVMPAEPLELWKSDPFEPEIRDGKIYARGADDDKGQLFMHVKAFEAMAATGTLPCNVKFLIEGGEEVGSPGLGLWCEQNKELLKADVILVSDTNMVSWQQPSITVGLRGIAYMEVEVTGPCRDLHSGHYGGAVRNPLNALAAMIDSLIDDEGRVAVPGFYDKVKVYSEAERAEYGKLPFDMDEYKHALDIDAVAGEEGFTTMERTGLRPALDVNGIWGGYTGEGTKTIIPSKGYAKISMRLVPHQDSNQIAQLFEKHFRSIAPEGVRVKVRALHGGSPYVTPTDHPAYAAARAAMEEGLGRRPLPFYSGGSIPVISTFEQVLGIKTVLMGFGLEEDAIHSPNESFALECFHAGIDTIPLFYKYFTQAR